MLFPIMNKTRSVEGVSKLSQQLKHVKATYLIAIIYALIFRIVSFYFKDEKVQSWVSMCQVGEGGVCGLHREWAEKFTFEPTSYQTFAWII